MQRTVAFATRNTYLNLCVFSAMHCPLPLHNMASCQSNPLYAVLHSMLVFDMLVIIPLLKVVLSFHYQLATQYKSQPHGNHHFA